jgi:hypothetical protein
MRKFIFVVIFIFSLSAAFNVEAQKKRRKIMRNQTNNQAKVILEGQHSGIEKPFIFVARDSKTYEILKKLQTGLPEASKFDFPRVAVVAIFAGTKPTPGYSIEISKKSNAFAVSISSPPRDAILAQVLTSPYKIVAIPVDEEKPLIIQTPSDWEKEVYKVSKGYIEYSGGFAPRQKSFDVDGKISVFRLADLVTVSFSLAAKINAKIMACDVASGKLEGDKIQLNWIDPGNFSELPRPSMKATGVFTENRITLRFEPNPTNVADGFEAYGEIEFVKAK